MSRDVLAAHPELRFRLYRLAFSAGKRLPLGLARFLAFAIGTAWYWSDRHGRGVVRRNLAHLIPRRCPEALQRAVRRTYTDFAITLAESLAIPRFVRERLAPRVELIDPFGVFRQRPLAGPAILATVHANWELSGACLHHLGLTAGIEAIALGHGDPRIDALFDRMREHMQCRSLLLDRAPLASLRALKAGKILVVVGDRDYSQHGLRVPFAGAPLSMPVGPAALAVQTQAPIIPYLCARRGRSHFTLIIGRPICADPTMPKTTQVPQLTARLARTFARFVGTVPSQWCMFHPAWDDGRPPSVS